jgi:dTDP-4-dehydrorhamnose reductase
MIQNQRILVTGSKGMLGTDLMSALAGHPNVIGVDLGELDVTDGTAVMSFFGGFRPGLVYNLAAFTDVDGSEKDRDSAYMVNAIGAGNVAAAAEAFGARLVHIGTDYVFDGAKGSPYTEEDETNPISHYGWTKLEGEKLIVSNTRDSVIIRTQWLFGLNGRNFIKTILRFAREKDHLTVVDDQVGSPTFTRDLAAELIAAAGLPAGIYNIAAGGYCSWFEFSREILRAAGIRKEVIPIKTRDLSRPAKRPQNSRLDCSKYKKATGRSMRNWAGALQDYLKEERG